jgi:hypothetical protein
VPEIESLISAVKDGQVVGNAAEAYAAIAALRVQADKYERDLVRALRWEDDNETVRYKSFLALLDQPKQVMTDLLAAYTESTLSGG